MFCATAFGFPEPRGDVQSHVRHYASRCALRGMSTGLDDSDPSLKEKFQEENCVHEALEPGSVTSCSSYRQSLRCGKCLHDTERLDLVSLIWVVQLIHRVQDVIFDRSFHHRRCSAVLAGFNWLPSKLIVPPSLGMIVLSWYVTTWREIPAQVHPLPPRPSAVAAAVPTKICLPTLKHNTNCSVFSDAQFSWLGTVCDTPSLEHPIQSVDTTKKRTRPVALCVLTQVMSDANDHCAVHHNSHIFNLVEHAVQGRSGQTRSDACAFCVVRSHPHRQESM